MTRHTMSRRGGDKETGSARKQPHAALNRKAGLLLFGGIVCAAIIAIVVVGRFWGAGDTSQPQQKPQQTEPSGVASSRPRAPAPPAEPPDLLPEPPATPPEPSDLPPEPAIPPPEPPASPPEPAAASPQTASATRATVEALEQEAIDVVNRLREAFPSSSTPLALMGMVHARFGSVAEAMKWWEKCLEVNPKHPEVYDAMANIAMRKQEYQRAVKLWRQTLQINPRMPGVRNGIARALMGLGRISEAVAVLEEEIKIAPGQRLSHNLLGKAYLQLAEFEQARNCYEAALQVQPDYAKAHYGLAMAYARLGQMEKSREYMQKFQEVKGVDREVETDRKRVHQDLPSVRQLVALAHTEVGRVYRERGYLREAEEHWLRAAVLDPKNFICRSQLARLYVHNGSFEEAIKLYQELAAAHPKIAGFHLKLGILLGRMNQKDAALAAVQRAIRLDPDNASYRQIYQEISEGK